MRGRRSGIFVGVCVVCAAPALADEPLIENLRNLTIEQLANVEITSVSRRPETLSQAAAAVDVITSDEIERSGAQSLPEVLRLAHNLEVAQVNAQQYAISARGFNSFQAANKLLVLVDGRPIYTPLYSGVLWDEHDVPLADIERIEVISGPGGALWGANAVNGVINIITRSSADTQGAFANAFLGTLDQRLDLRYGGRFGARGPTYRVDATGFARGDAQLPSGASASDAWSMGEAGFRLDGGDSSNQYTLDGQIRHRIDDDGKNEGGHLLGRWSRQFDRAGTLQLQTYYSRDSATQGGVSDDLRVWDIDLQHSFQDGAHQIVWGGEYRVSNSNFVNQSGSAGTLVPAARALHTASLFAEDDIALREDLKLVLGLKGEYDTYSHMNYMPSVRLAWQATDTSLLWAAVSRAVRTPSRIERDLVIPGTFVQGGIEPERLTAYELGYRAEPTHNMSLSVNLYYDVYEGVRTLNLTPPGALPAFYGNGLHGPVYGLETWGDLAVTRRWRMSAGVTLLQSNLHTDPLTSDFNGTGLDPHYQVFLRSDFDFAKSWTFDLDLRAIGRTSPEIPAYAELNSRLGWRINKRVEIAFDGRNLLHEAHAETFDSGPPLEIPRSFQLSARLTY